MDIQLDSFNVLDASQLPKRPNEHDLDPDSPPAVRANLDIDKLDRKLFPILVTGVRLWPFLTLAFRCKNKGHRAKVFQCTKRFRKALIKLMQRARMGPLTWTSLRPYVSMCGKVNGAGKNDLREFIRTREFEGKPRFFVCYRHEERWKKLLVDACGRQGKAFVKAYTKAGRECGVVGVVTEIISKSPRYYDEILWHGAFSYAFLRCLYGYYDRYEDVSSFQDPLLVFRWSRMLLKIIKNKQNPVPDRIRSKSRYLNLLQRIIDSGQHAEPPLGHITKRFRKEDRPVLEGLRLGVFYNLYFKPTPFTVWK